MPFLAGIDLGLAPFVATKVFCELADAPVEVLRQRIAEGLLGEGDIEVHRDVRKLKIKQEIDLLSGGFPCPDISQAGDMTGLFLEDGSPTRSGLFFALMKIARRCKIPLLFLENVANICNFPMRCQA